MPDVTQVTQVTQFRCPKCFVMLEPMGGESTRCPTCGWAGRARLFRPVEPFVERAQDALPDDATCIHHPSKQAVAICEGTGDYICSLCAIELDGKTYSAQYLDRAGKDKLAAAFDRDLPRPDRAMGTYLAGAFLLSCFGVVLIPFAIHQFIKALRLHKTNDLYRRVRSRTSIVLGGLVLFAIIGLMAVGAVAILMDID